MDNVNFTVKGSLKEIQDRRHLYYIFYNIQKKVAPIKNTFEY